jgi:hypothetical protein
MIDTIIIMTFRAGGRTRRRVAEKVAKNRRLGHQRGLLYDHIELIAPAAAGILPPGPDTGMAGHDDGSTDSASEHPDDASCPAVSIKRTVHCAL